MRRLDQLNLAPAERDEIAARAMAAAQAAGLRSVVVVGSANIAYLTGGVIFPYLDQQVIHPVALHVDFASGRRRIFCTADVARVPPDCGWRDEVTVYPLTEDTPEASLARVLGAAVQGDSNGAATVGFDAGVMTGALHRALAARLPSHDLVPADGFLRDLRLVKTDAEVRMLEIAARIGDRAYISALNHAEGAALDRLSFPIWEYGERFRVHVGEFEGSAVGTLAIMPGERAKSLQSRTGTREVFADQTYVRIEYSMSNRGYWLVGSRTAFAGRPGADARRAYADNVRLRSVALASLKAGTRACDVFDAVRRSSEAMGIPFWEAGEVGHGVGASEREAPFLSPFDETVLRPNMVLAVGVYTYGPGGELICNRDVYLVTDGEPELLSWYKDWSDLYAIHGTSARHG